MKKQRIPRQIKLLFINFFSRHNRSMKKTYFIIGITALLLFSLDQLLKWVAVVFFNPAVTLLPGISLRYEQNFGIAWSIPVPYPLLITLNILLLFLIPWYLAKNLDLTQKKVQIFLSFIIGGALGNLFDRIFRGYVIDYMAVGTFPVFNLADALLTCGIFLILLFYDKIKGKAT